MTTVLEACRVPPPPNCRCLFPSSTSFGCISTPSVALSSTNTLVLKPSSWTALFQSLNNHFLSPVIMHVIPISSGTMLSKNSAEITAGHGYCQRDRVFVYRYQFDELTGNHARDSDQFYDFMPQMPPLTEEGEYKIAPLIALQVTLFPGRGICIGLSNHHCLGDARSVVRFMRAWASINKFGRGRPNALFDPPVPVNYFGNCLGGGRVSVKHKDLAADDGFLIAAEAIVDQIKTKIYNKEEFLNGQDKLLSEMPQYKNMRIFVVSGSPKFDLSNGDFGWGEARKVEVLSLDGGKYSMSLCNYDGGLLVGLSLPSQRMEAFAAIFQHGLNHNL